MAERILMQVSGAVQPLRLGGPGPALTTAEQPDWAGPPLEVHGVSDWEGDAEMGPLGGTLGLLVFLTGSVDFLARGRKRDRAWSGRCGDVAVLSGDRVPRMLRCRGQAQVAAVDVSATWIWATAGGKPPAPRSTLRLGAQPSIASEVTSLLRHARQGSSDPLQIETLSFDLISGLLDALPGQQLDHRAIGLSRAACRRVQSYVYEHLGERITHAALAGLVGLGPRHFSTLFKRSFAITPYQYVLTMRLREAARLMRTTRRDLAEIAYEVGFSSQSHFSTAFQRVFRVRPRDYARDWRSSVVLIHAR
ncbi:MAG: AraC family transcriptional regulator [Myxococcales bacterium]|nr:AraC family transcriptional regulator [Myxococcales bacterium]MDD9964981.1 AraC family transcriptional regulator [Myxococcales bacterium]